MLATMATVTSGILSPNSYGLSSDAVSLKIGRKSPDMDTFHHPSYHNSSDSEQDTPTKTDAPKRNKRKNFKPRCSSVQSSLAEEEALNLAEYGDNNNLGGGARRRKPLAQPRKVMVDPRFSPMDLSGGRQQESDSNSDSDEFNTEKYRNASENEDNNEQSENSETDSKIPSSFSIHNLSKPHVVDVQQNLSPDQVAEMRNYAMNTMRELLGIYGLTSEVAESISRQLPIAAFSTGKIFENLTLNPPYLPKKDATPLSEPPTPPSTPLSPKDDRKAPSSFGHHRAARAPEPPEPPNPDRSQRNGSAHAQVPDFPFGLLDGDGFRQGHRLEGGGTPGGAHRGIFPGNVLPYSHLNKTDSLSPPPLEPSPLSAMIQQSMAPTIQPREHLMSSTNVVLGKTTQLDYSKYVKKFSSSLECSSTYCKDLNYREHFHCLDCNSRVFIKKEEMIRHFKWHKKRDESLQHGFMRYSPLDDCSDKFGNCTHNKKQTHYHCIQENCDKVYISTSDVQMHSNYHRKDSAIMQEGFQRYRATEECGASYCAFFGQRTTHFHCRRPGCRFTFKNKSDMEKHKSYHIKDEQLSRDGFKKFMKNEMCPFENCRFSKVCNHIHCIRPQCSYVLHSSGQLFSHKRKHERKDSELAYRKYKLAQSMMRSLSDSGVSTQMPFSPLNRDYEAQIDMANFYNQQTHTSNMSTESLSDRNSPLSYNEESEGASAMDLSASEASNFAQPEDSYSAEDLWKKFCQLVPENACRETCEYHFQDHYHCTTDNCEMIFNTKEAAREHARNHEQQEIVSENYFTTPSGENEACEEGCSYQNREKHFHCGIDNCREVILASDKPFRRLEHYKMHQYSQKLSLTKDPLTATHLATSIDGMFCRKRGRPPKNRVIEVWNDYNPMGTQGIMDSPQAIFTSFKLPKPSTTSTGTKEVEQDSNDDASSTHSPSNAQDYLTQGFDVYNENTKCPDTLCPYLGASHFHCSQIRCSYATDKEEVLTLHSKDFHENIEILEGFEFIDRSVDCRLPNCASNRINRHFHCTRPNCNFSFVQYSNMIAHNQRHMDESQSAPSIRVKSEDLLVDREEKFEDNQFRAINLSQSDAKVSESPQQMDQPNNTLYGPDTSCSRPFCKLKRKFHYHCNACNQAFSEQDKLVSHVAKHSSGALNASNVQEDNNNSEAEGESPQNLMKSEQKITVAPLQSLQNPQVVEKQQQQQQQPPEQYFTPTFDAYNHFGNFPPNFATQIALMQQQNAFLPQGIYPGSQIMFQHAQLMQSPLLGHQNQVFQGENMTSPLAAMAANLNKRSMSPHDMNPEAKKARIQNSMRILKDEPVPAGYLRFRFNEDCKYQHCGYREHQTHFHCQRIDCGYSFCDKTRFVQHTARHERLDTLMGGDFQQYRANVACGRPDCAYTANLGSTQNKASHFHCLKCDFVCTDTNKVVAHRRQHQKLDSIQAAGFEKFTPSQICRVQNCQHSGKQTHYHCLSCQYAVLGLAQMSAHKYRHMEG